MRAVLVLVMASAACGTPAHQAPDAPTVKPDAPTSGCGGDEHEQCNVLTQQGCCLGFKCSWIIDFASPPLGHIDCAPEGNVPVGSPCTVGSAGVTGFDDCVGGSACVAGTCELICDPAGGVPTCPAGLMCRIHSGFLGPPGGEVAGVCESP